MHKEIKDWDDAYANGAHVPGSADLPALWAKEAADYVAKAAKVEQDIPYGDHPREMFDLVWPDGTPKGLLVFVHGGYWMRFDKSYWTAFAEGARAQGWAVCLPSYQLAPDASISKITTQFGTAITAAATRVAGPIRLAGHSAGGHLVMRMLCSDSPLPGPVRARLAHVLSISGVHDLRPLLRTAMNDTLRLDPAMAIGESPALSQPFGDVPSTCWVGGGERPEFIRQAQVMALIWEGFDAPTACFVDGMHDHFSILDGMRHKDSAIVQCLLQGDV